VYGLQGSRDLSIFSGPMKPGFEGAGSEIFDPRFGLIGVFFTKNITPFNWQTG